MRSQNPFIILPPAPVSACADAGTFAGTIESENSLRGGVGKEVGRLEEAELRRVAEGLRDEESEGGKECAGEEGAELGLWVRLLVGLLVLVSRGGKDVREMRWASEEAFSPMSASLGGMLARLDLVNDGGDEDSEELGMGEGATIDFAGRNR